MFTHITVLSLTTLCFLSYDLLCYDLLISQSYHELFSFLSLPRRTDVEVHYISQKLHNVYIQSILIIVIELENDKRCPKYVNGNLLEI